MKNPWKLVLLFFSICSLLFICYTVVVKKTNEKSPNKYEDKITSTIPNRKPVLTKSDSIPQGKMIYELYFAEFGGRMGNLPVEIVIIGNKIRVYNNMENPLTGGSVIVEGILVKHKSGKWIISERETDRDSEEIGGCTDGPVPIDFVTKIIEWC